LIPCVNRLTQLNHHNILINILSTTFLRSNLINLSWLPLRQQELSYQLPKKLSTTNFNNYLVVISACRSSNVY
ncbi:hypothetical protein, partial [Lactiplantibacillus pentosus]|uniref:hypothetical protein n=2 Tax=Lactiplantibacillus pentosus TaxID=1589 RepID=UPI001CDBC3BE